MSTFPSELEDEAIYVIREAAAQFERPVILFSGGKDSVVIVQLAVRAFAPFLPPFLLLHIDTGHNFPEVLRFRDDLVAALRLTLVVRSVQDSIDRGRVVEETGRGASRNALQTTTLLDAIRELRVDVCLGGARRDEEKARAKERLFSVRSEFGEWHPHRQRPELFDMLNGRIAPGEHVRAFPISNWTEADVWRYVAWRRLALPAVYFSHQRAVFERDGALWPESPFVERDQSEPLETACVRFRTVGDMTCTAAVASDAATPVEVLAELTASRHSERSARLDDRRAEAAMEARKRVGYF